MTMVTETGKRLFTPMLIVMIAIGTTDLIFALDSIPAIFGITKEPYLVFTANVFALMGLRQLYFLLGGLLERLVYLNIGLAFVLAFIGVKLVLEALHTNTLPFINGGARRALGAGDPDLAVAAGHPRHAGHRHGREPGQVVPGPRRRNWSTARRRSHDQKLRGYGHSARGRTPRLRV